MRIHSRFLKEASNFLVSAGTVVKYTLDKNFVLYNVVSPLTYKVDMFILDIVNEYLDLSIVKREIKAKGYSMDIYNNLVLFIESHDREFVLYDNKYKAYNLLDVPAEDIDKLVGIDEKMKKSIAKLNNSVYRTIGCCEGHGTGIARLYIEFVCEGIEDELISYILETTPIVEWSIKYIRTLKNGVLKIATMEIKTESPDIRINTLNKIVYDMVDYRNRQE